MYLTKKTLHATKKYAILLTRFLGDSLHFGPLELINMHVLHTEVPWKMLQTLALICLHIAYIPYFACVHTIFHDHIWLFQGKHIHRNLILTASISRWVGQK